MASLTQTVASASTRVVARASAVPAKAHAPAPTVALGAGRPARFSAAKPARMTAARAMAAGDSGYVMPPPGEPAATASKVDIRRVMATLEEDTRNFFDKGADYTIYDEGIVYADPVAIFTGKAAYAGMISTMQIMNFGVFEKGTSFEVVSIEETDIYAQPEGQYLPRSGFTLAAPAAAAIDAKWRLYGTTKWGGKMIMTGHDIFRISEAGLVVSHESAWEEAPYEIVKEFLPENVKNVVGTIEDTTRPIVTPILDIARPVVTPVIDAIPSGLPGAGLVKSAAGAIMRPPPPPPVDEYAEYNPDTTYN